MQAYQIQGDLNEQRGTYLKLLLALTAGVALPLAGLSAASSLDGFQYWVGLAVVLLAAHLLRKRGNLPASTWLYILGLLGFLSLSLWRYGPSTTAYFLMVLPVVLASPLINAQTRIYLALLCISLIFGITAAQAGLGAAFSLCLVPVLFCAVLTAVMYMDASNILDIVYWATDIQQKDAHRAELFYAQKEELGRALLDVTHANSKLELLNTKLAEAQHKTEQVSKAKSIFLSNMSHELRTPLNVIIGYTSTMLDMPGMYDNTPLPAEYRADIQLVKDNGYYLLGLINDILDLSKIEAGKLELHRSSVDLPDMFKGIIATSIGLVKDKPVQIRPDYAENLPQVWADPLRVRQIILNLMSNACKFTHSGSVTLHAHIENGSIHVSVIDTGIGIPEKALTHIFDRFQQAQQDTDKHYGGTGLGLDISKQLAHMHGGDLWVKSVLGQGSAFTFSLPLLTAQEVEPVEPIQEISSVQALPTIEPAVAYTVLLVEDEISMRDMMRRTLESAEHVVVDVPDGAHAIEMAVGLLPDLIILDIRLPNLNGWQILEYLKRNVETARIPVIVCTVNEDEEHANELGAEIYLRKPFSADELLACVGSLLPSSLQA